MADIERILIVGGGISGLTLATALHQQGFKAELVERSPTWPAVGAGILLHANGLRVLRELGLDEAVERAGGVVRSWRWCDQHGEPLAHIDLETLWGEVGPCICIERPKLQQALVVGAAAVPCRLGTAVTSLTQDERQVSVGFSDGSRWDYDLVVGADGLHSTVRELTFGAVSIGYTGWMIRRSVLPPLHLQDIHGFTVLVGDRSFFGLMPTGGGLAYGFGGVGMPNVYDPLEGRLERFRQQFGAFGGPVPAYLAALSSDEQIHGGPIEWVEVERWYQGRVVLVGDAAHAGPPMMAEGGCMAMEDALVLAEVLYTADSLEQALDTYVTRRRPRADWVQQHSRAVAERVLQPPAIRNAALREQEGQAFLDRFKPLIPAP